ncbi:uncharacterized protein LOC111024965 [Momordica charantia]|uniref:Uncharacterized protein LOC111024965 n=1 Tax=Momordica charantia TaxID=3673 RepID=A0A6J1DVZ5_MOMCH|nr:uncharacterized protein LOC111024965 [Momordica charantia]
MVKGLGANYLQILSDSELIVNQITEEYQTKEPQMEKYLGKVRSHLSHFQAYEISQIPRFENSNADALAKLASTYETDLARSVSMEILDTPSILEPVMIEVNSQLPLWMDPIKEFLAGNVLVDAKEAKKMSWRIARYLLRDRTMYWCGFSLPLLQCISKENGNYVLREVHEKVCGNHLGVRSLSAKIIRQGYYWPTIDQNAKEFVKACDNCQRFANIIHQPSELLTRISAPWPFAKWGVDLIRPFPLGKGQTKYVVIAGSRPRRSQTSRRQLGISHFGSSLAHPKANGHVEAINKIIKRGLKLRFDVRKGRWAEELPEVLWSYQTTPRESTSETPFAMAFSSEAVVLVEISMPTEIVDYYEQLRNEEEPILNLDLLDEKGKRFSYV